MCFCLRTRYLSVRNRLLYRSYHNKQVSVGRWYSHVNLLDQKSHVPKRGSFLIISAFRIQVFFNLWFKPVATRMHDKDIQRELELAEDSFFTAHSLLFLHGADMVIKKKIYNILSSSTIQLSAKIDESDARL